MTFKARHYLAIYLKGLAVKQLKTSHKAPRYCGQFAQIDQVEQHEINRVAIGLYASRLKY